MAFLAAPANAFVALLQLVIGLVLAFAGLRLAEGLAGFAGFLGGAALGLVLGTLVAGPVGGLVAALVLGILLALLARVALRLLAAVLLGGAAASLALAFGLPVYAAAILALVAGLVGLVAHRMVLIVATASLGATSAASAGVFLLRKAWPSWDEEVAFLVTALALAVAGIVAQARAARSD